MIIALRLLFAAILLCMLGTIAWASSQCALGDIPREVFQHPWFLATLADAYFAFIAFWAWLAWKETRPLAGALWLVAILLWGNIAIATYMLIELFRVPATASSSDIFTTRRPGHLWLPATFSALGVAVYALSI